MWVTLDSIIVYLLALIIFLIVEISRFTFIMPIISKKFRSLKSVVILCLALF